MNERGHTETLIAAHPGNLNAVKSGAHSPRLIEARASEIVDQLGGSDELDEAGKVAFSELARLTAVIEAIDHDLSERGITDKNGKERYLLQRRERYSRRLMDVSDRVLEARARTQKKRAIGASEVVGEQSDYVRHLQAIALGHDPEARVSERLAALRVLTELGVKGTSSYFEPRTAVTELYPDDPAFRAEAEKLAAELAEVRKEAALERLRNEINTTRLFK